jgi:hypothetical protein
MLTSAQQDAIEKLVATGGVARLRSDGQVEVRTSSFRSRSDYLVTVAGETIPIHSLTQSRLWLLGNTLVIVGGVLFFLAMPLWILTKMGVVPSLRVLWLVPVGGWCLLVVGLMFSDEEGVLASAKKQFVSSGKEQRLTDDLPVGQWVTITKSDGDGGGD